MANKKEIYISPGSIVITVLILAAFYFLFFIKDIILLFFVVLILTIAFRPAINRWEKKIGRLPSVLALLVIIILILGLLIYEVVPPLINQFKDLIVALPDLADKAGRVPVLAQYKPVIYENLKTISSNPERITGSFVSITTNVFSGLFAFITILVLTIYMLLERDSLSNIVTAVIPSDQQESAINVLRKISNKIGNWFRGQLLLCLVIGLVYLIILLILGIPYALPLAVIAGILEIVPTIGPIISGILAFLVALTVSPLVAFLAVIFFVLVQQFENSYLVPKIMQKAVGLSPVIIILAILVGAKIFGILGALLAVPIAASVSVIIRDWPIIRQSFNKNGD